MDAATAGLLAAAVGVGGTLGSAWLVQRRADAIRREEWRYLERTRVADLSAQRRSGVVEARRAAYIAFNAAARHYLASLSDHVHALRLGTEAPQPTFDVIDAARAEYRQWYAEAQMIVPDEVLTQVRAVNTGIGSVYGVLVRLTHGTAREGEDITAAQSRIKESWRALSLMRAAMRADLGVTAPSHG
ncbi:hypothetical protein OKJ48_27130 [Streptomyces kunmingensis]|uniref:Secreted protein n=1 Tax=Streptomyces kunmingensis TaxID=68225 RepID=A0ABU6CGN9_9ACTN|nr:hypothetical protein [Streptomyces kunmingensis]MEB3963883.1 hypothetical protein [Streptomyces kunmingensis]